MAIGASDPEGRNVMPRPVSISIKQVSTAAKGTVAKVLEQHKTRFPKPDYHFGYFPPHWWLGVIIYKPDVAQITLSEAQRLATDVHAGMTSAVSAVKGGKPGVIVGDGTLTIGFAPPTEINLIEE
jgi:hypothetical protein